MQEQEQEQERSFYYNVLIVGYTGIGKTELVNYVFGVEKKKSSIGSPDTQVTTPYIGLLFDF